MVESLISEIFELLDHTLENENGM